MNLNKIDQKGGLRLKNLSNHINPKEPLVTIITSVFNGEAHLEETILSILNQNYKNIEYIIIDGQSEDTTLDIIKKYEDKIDIWISQKDEGIYYGFNKGLKLANGDLIGFVNSDDILMPNAVSTLISYYKKYPEVDFIFGSVKKHWGVLHGYNPWKIYLSWGFYTSHSTGFFIKKNAAKLVGDYNTEYKYSSDYDYFYRMIVKKKLKGIATKKNEVFGIFRRGGFSSRVRFIDHFMETIKIRLDNKQNKFVVLIIFILKFIKNIKKL